MGMKLYFLLRAMIYRLVIISTLFAVFGIAGCASTPLGASLHNRSMGISNDKIFVGTETIHVKGLYSVIRREVERYTCGPNGVMWCDISGNLATCNCQRRSAF